MAMSVIQQTSDEAHDTGASANVVVMSHDTRANANVVVMSHDTRVHANVVVMSHNTRANANVVVMSHDTRAHANVVVMSHNTRVHANVVIQQLIYRSYRCVWLCHQTHACVWTTLCLGAIWIHQYWTRWTHQQSSCGWRLSIPQALRVTWIYLSHKIRKWHLSDYLLSEATFYFVGDHMGALARRAWGRYHL